MRNHVGACLSVLLGWSAAHAVAKDLNVGDAVPQLEVKEFVRGEPLRHLERGKTYVVDFWATWCVPCKGMIPHLTTLQKKYKDVTFIGVSVWESDQAAVKPFVKEMGEKMDYRIAIDAVPERGKPKDGAMAKNWLGAAAEENIPMAFIVDPNGKLAWVGHPAGIEQPLTQIVRGTWDLEAAARQYKKEHDPIRKVMPLLAKVEEARQSGDSKTILTLVDDAIAGDPEVERFVGIYKFWALARRANTRDQALDYGRHLVEMVLRNNARSLNDLAWYLVAPGGKHEGKFPNLALMAAQRANELTGGKDISICDTLAKAYFDSGDTAKAVETQARVLDLAKGTPRENDEALKGRLERYRKAAMK